jgi:hypothetical protein
MYIKFYMHAKLAKGAGGMQVRPDKFRWLNEMIQGLE